ncbi:hypothetical protein M7I_7227 [Glarea lozoyensis 74030]|uniref:Uncharacterized protein n=1 Tax=Glarea lozoyensis (strain ATCC 74030 / MF5533) TaxID=1104152 RepID=H0EWQ4_GLAL7|nr:hypothetical protein M7I_7227 [Glarea lozoyensis 74030]
MEEEILRQIREEGLLDGIDLENIDVNQEDQISERIAEAFRRRQEEKAEEERDRKRSSDRRRQARSSANNSREASGDEGRNPGRVHSRTTSSEKDYKQQSKLYRSHSSDRSLSKTRSKVLDRLKQLKTICRRQ